MSLLVEAHDLTKNYDLDGQVVHALRGATLAIRAGDSLSIMGPSGCGKSTLLHLLGAMDVPTAGRLVLLGRDAARLSDAERTALRLRHFGFVFQRFFLLPMLTAAENVSLPLLEAGVGRADRERRLQEVFETVGLAHRARHKPGQLSGGEQQRVAVARALMNSPRVILADEPSGNLDSANSEKLHDLIWNLSREHGHTFVVVTHNEALAKRADKVARIVDGVIQLKKKKR